MYLPHGSWAFHVLVQDQQTFGLRIVVIPNGREALRVLDGVPEADADQVWAARVAEIADPPLAPAERVVPIGDFMDAAIKMEPTAAELPCPECRSTLYWRGTGIS